MAYYVFLGVAPLPITPGKISISTPSKNETVDLINDGEVSILKGHGLKTVTFEFLLPQNRYPFANFDMGAMDATAFVTYLKGIELEKLPIPFIVSRAKPNGTPSFFTSFLVTLEDFELIEDASANGLDVLCSVTLREYKFYGSTFFSTSNLVMLGAGAVAAGATSAITAIKNNKTTVSTTKSRDSSSKITPKTYKVKEGDTLWGIAKREFGDGERYKDIAELNKISNPDLIQIGQELRLS